MEDRTASEVPIRPVGSRHKPTPLGQQLAVSSEPQLFQLPTPPTPSCSKNNDQHGSFNVKKKGVGNSVVVDHNQAPNKRKLAEPSKLKDDGKTHNIIKDVCFVYF